MRTALLALSLLFASTSGTDVVRVREQSFALDKSAGSPSGAGVCPEGPPSKRVTYLDSPRVDEVACGGTRFLLGLDGSGKILWRRPLGFHSGKYTFDEIVVGAAREGVVLNNLTVLAPGTGKVLFAPPTHPVDKEARPVPDFDLAESTIFLPDRRAFVTFEADVSLFERSGGVYLLDPRTGKRDLLLPVSTSLLGGYWRVEAMALDASRRHLLLGHRFSFRGPGGVSFVVYELAERRTVYEERFIEDHYGGELAFAVDGRGNVGFSFADLTAGKRRLVQYRIGPQTDGSKK
jgi:hypothetical protein